MIRPARNTTPIHASDHAASRYAPQHADLIVRQTDPVTIDPLAGACRARGTTREIIMHRTNRLLVAAASVLIAGGLPAAHAQPPAPTPPTATPTAPAAPKPDPSLPSGKDILAKYVAATGGKDAWAKITSQRAESSLEAPAQGLKGTIRTEQAKSGGVSKMRMEFEIPAMGVIVTGFDGTTGWSTNPMQGPRVMKGPELTQIREMAQINRELDPDAHYTSIDTVGTDNVGDVACYKVVFTPKEGKPETRFYDKSTFLLLRTVSTQVSEMGEMTGETTFADYRDVDGVKLPFSATQKVMGAELKITTIKAAFNEAIADDRFSPPADVKKLMDQSAKKDDETDDKKGQPKKGG